MTATAAAPAPKKRSCVKSYSPFQKAIVKHPYVDRLHYQGIVRDNYVGRDANGNLLFVFLKNVIPKVAVEKAASILRKAPRNADMRSAINGGQPPQSGITGYYDYSGTPMQYKCRKTAFTHDNFDTWKSVYPLIEYTNEVYKTVLPNRWKLQNEAIPNPVRIRGSVFSTCTVNNQFRTAVHTDNGDFDDGFGVITVLDGDWEGVMLGFPSSRLCIDVRQGDILLFNTHCQHGNTELESLQGTFERLSCVLYYRHKLGDTACLRTMQMRKKDGDHNPTLEPPSVDEHRNGINTNQTCQYPPRVMSLFTYLQGWGEGHGGGVAEVTERLSRVDAELMLIFEIPTYGQESGAARTKRLKTYSKPREYHSMGLGDKPGSSNAAANDEDEGDRGNSPAARGPAVVKRVDGHKSVGGFSESYIKTCERDIEENRVDLLSKQDILRNNFGDSLARAWAQRSREWLAHVGKEYKAVCKVKARDEAQLRLARRKDGADRLDPLRVAFARVCEVLAAGYEAMNGQESIGECPKHPRISFWLGCTTHLLRRMLHEERVPLTFLPVTALYNILLQYDEQCEKVLYPAAAAFALTRKDAADLQRYRVELKTLRPEGRAVYTTPKIVPWAANDRYDYQTEDRAVDYPTLGLPPPTAPGALPSYVRRIRSKKREMPAHVYSAAGGAARPLRVLVWTHAVPHKYGGARFAQGGEGMDMDPTTIPPTVLTPTFRRQFRVYCEGEAAFGKCEGGVTGSKAVNDNDGVSSSASDGDSDSDGDTSRSNERDSSEDEDTWQYMAVDEGKYFPPGGQVRAGGTSRKRARAATPPRKQSRASAASVPVSGVPDDAASDISDSAADAACEGGRPTPPCPLPGALFADVHVNFAPPSDALAYRTEAEAYSARCGTLAEAATAAAHEVTAALATAAQPYDVVCIVGMAACVSKEVLREELEAARKLVSREGLVLIKEFSANPIDHSRLKPAALRNRRAAHKKLREVMCARRRVPLVRHWGADELAAWVPENARYSRACAFYQVENSCMQECYVGFRPLDGGA